jgi:protein-disulfide isomerase
MRRALLSAVLLLAPTLLAPTVPALAADPGFTPAQRQEIIEIVRQALKSDPSILRDAVGTLQADDQARDQADQKARIAANQKALTANFSDPVAGNPNGDVTLVEFYDPRCPYCRKMLPSLASMIQKDPGLRIVYKDIPVLGPASTMEARAILAAKMQGGYSKMQEALMRDPAQPSDQLIRDTARTLGLDPAKLVADMNSPSVTAQIEANLTLARTLKVDGTPAWVIGQTLVPGAVDEGTLEALIADKRRKG